MRIHQVDARRAAAPKVKTGLVQANVGIIEKWDPAVFARLLALHQEASAQLAHDGAQLMVWPESSYPYPLPRTFAHDFPLEDGRRVRRGFDTPLLFGALTETVGPQRTRADPLPVQHGDHRNANGNVTAT